MIKTAKDLGALIRQRRKKMRLSQAELAGICNVGNRFLVELEAGKPTIQFDKALHVAANVGLKLHVHKKGDES